jgi:hypothetical protein
MAGIDTGTIRLHEPDVLWKVTVIAAGLSQRAHDRAEPVDEGGETVQAIISSANSGL